MDIFSIFFVMKVRCVFSLDSLHRGDSNEYTQYTIFNIKENHPKFSKICSYEIFTRDSRTCSKQPGQRAISVRAIEVLLYVCLLCLDVAG